MSASSILINMPLEARVADKIPMRRLKLWRGQRRAPLTPACTAMRCLSASSYRITLLN